MASQCKDTQPLLPTYLDGELAPHDRLSLEHHLADCPECSAVMRAESEYLDRVRALLAPPEAPAQLQARIGELLDREDRQEQRARRRVGWSWALPGFASAAAAAALALFAVGEVRTATEPRGEAPVVRQAVRDRLGHWSLRPDSGEISVAAQQMLGTPVSTGPAHRESAPTMRGWLPRELDGHPALMLDYDVSDTSEAHQVTVHVLYARDLDLSGRERIAGTSYWVSERAGVSTVTYKDRRGIGYVFSSDADLSWLLDVVVQSGLVQRVNASLGL